LAPWGLPVAGAQGRTPSKWRKASFGSVKTACSAEARHDLPREQLHRAPHALLGQAAEVHPAEHLADAEAAQLVDLLGDRVGGAGLPSSRAGERSRRRPAPPSGTP